MKNRTSDSKQKMSLSKPNKRNGQRDLKITTEIKEIIKILLKIKMKISSNIMNNFQRKKKEKNKKSKSLILKLY